MRNYFAFIKKEITESIRTYKALIIVLVFLIFGITNPLIAKMTPDLISSLVSDSLAAAFPEPSAMDSWTQFFKNVSQLGLVVVLILFSGILANELSRGTLTNMLTKGLSRSTVVLSKYTVMILLWTVSYALCFLATLGYTVFLFPNDSVDNLLFAVFGLWLSGVFLLSVLMFAASITSKSFACLLIAAGVAGILLMANIVPTVQDYNPLTPASSGMALLTGTMTVDTLYPALIVAAGCSVALVAASVLVFRKKQL